MFIYFVLSPSSDSGKVLIRLPDPIRGGFFFAADTGDKRWRTGLLLL